MNFRYVKSRKSNCKKLKKVTLRKFEEYIDNELKNKIIQVLYQILMKYK